MSTAKFRNMISNYNRFVPKSVKKQWSDYFHQTPNQNRSAPKRTIRETILPEDVLIREMIDNIDFFLLYRSVEFRRKLRERLDYYEGKKV